MANSNFLWSVFFLEILSKPIVSVDQQSLKTPFKMWDETISIVVNETFCLFSFFKWSLVKTYNSQVLHGIVFVNFLVKHQALATYVKKKQSIAGFFFHLIKWDFSEILFSQNIFKQLFWINSLNLIHLWNPFGWNLCRYIKISYILVTKESNWWFRKKQLITNGLEKNGPVTNGLVKKKKTKEISN